MCALGLCQASISQATYCSRLLWKSWMRSFQCESFVSWRSFALSWFWVATGTTVVSSVQTSSLGHRGHPSGGRVATHGLSGSLCLSSWCQAALLTSSCTLRDPSEMRRRESYRHVAARPSAELADGARTRRRAHRSQIPRCQPSLRLRRGRASPATSTPWPARHPSRLQPSRSVLHGG